jgi:hypothetical protein
MEDVEVAYEAQCSMDKNDNVTVETNGEVTVNHTNCLNFGVKLDKVEMREFASACTHVADLLERS